MNRTLYPKLLGWCWWACVLGSQEEKIPVYIFGRNMEGMLYQSYFLQCGLKAKVFDLQKKWIAMRMEEDADYEDYDLKVFVKLPARKGAKLSDYKERRVSYLNLSKVNAFWKKVRDKDPHLSFIVEEEERKAKIKVMDEMGDKKVVFDKVYGFRTKISDIKDDILLERASKDPSGFLFTRDDVVLDYYFIYTNKIFTLEDTFTIGQFVRYFHKDHRSSEFTFHVHLAPVTDDHSIFSMQDSEELSDITLAEEDIFDGGNSDIVSSSKRPGIILGSMGLVCGLIYRRGFKEKEKIEDEGGMGV